MPWKQRAPTCQVPSPWRLSPRFRQRRPSPIHLLEKAPPRHSKVLFISMSSSALIRLTVSAATHVDLQNGWMELRKTSRVTGPGRLQGLFCVSLVASCKESSFARTNSSAATSPRPASSRSSNIRLISISWPRKFLLLRIVQASLSCDHRKKSCWSCGVAAGHTILRNSSSRTGCALERNRASSLARRRKRRRSTLGGSERLAM
mmetsp:Transcript_55844/g.120752  ORF Transcript_55844/g.120752 Transcript_55844/m.120752 type:complete len:204 (+) Transcript_55844:58-669(+)